jgi:DNA-binding MarR family transcriptional regulator
VPDAVDRIAEQWSQTRPEIATPAVAAAKRLGLAAARVDDEGGKALRAHDLDAGEFDVLAALLRQGEPHEAAPTLLAREALVSTSGMTKRLDRLERRGLLRRRPDPGDRRGVLVALTPDGITVAERAVPAHAEALARALAPLSVRDLDELSSLLRRLLGG